MEESRRNEINNKMHAYAVINWKYQGEAEALTDSDHINGTLELLEEDLFNEAREDEARELIDGLKALRVDGTVGKRLAVWANYAWKGCFSDDELNEYAHDYNTDADTLRDMIEHMEEERDDYGNDDEEFLTLLADCKAHLATLTA